MGLFKRLKKVRGSSDEIHSDIDLLKFHRLVSKRWKSIKEVKDGESDEEESVPVEKDLFEYVRNHIIGKDLLFEGPFGSKKIVYCDNTASGRSLTFIEDYIRENVLPTYGNTHTTTSETAVQTGQFRKDARAIIHKSVNGGPEDEVIFAGSGSTAAIQKLLHVLNFKTPPIVFLSPYEHHSNLLPWREIGAEVRHALQKENGEMDLVQLEHQLKLIPLGSREIVGSFSAGSNVTGMLVDTDEVAAVLHKYGAFAFFDYASAGPYVKIDMNPGKESKYGELSYKDAIFCSPHKFIGGPGTTGILVAKRAVFRNTVPSVPGGGTVMFVTETTHRYVGEIHEKEEGGTPAIVESIRTGLVFQLKDALSPEKIMEREESLVRLAHDRLKECENIIVLGGVTMTHKLPIFSFVVKHKESGRLLHHNFVSKLLNDLYGIQCRGGCMCAGPYAEQLLGIDEATALRIGDMLFTDRDLEEHHLRKRKAEVLKPGFVRLSLPFYMDDDTISMILEALYMVSTHGWKLLPKYEFDAGSGDWHHRDFAAHVKPMSLDAVSYDGGHMTHKDRAPCYSKGSAQPESVRRIAKYVLEISEPDSEVKSTAIPSVFPEEWEYLRWFLLPEEANCYLAGIVPDTCVDYQMPFFPGRRVQAKFSECAGVKNGHHQTFCNCSSSIRPDGSDSPRRTPIRGVSPYASPRLARIVSSPCL